MSEQCANPNSHMFLPLILVIHLSSNPFPFFFKYWKWKFEKLVVAVFSLSTFLVIVTNIIFKKKLEKLTLFVFLYHPIKNWKIFFFTHACKINHSRARPVRLGRGFVMHFHTRSAPTARFSLLYRNILFLYPRLYTVYGHKKLPTSALRRKTLHQYATQISIALITKNMNAVTGPYYEIRPF